MFSTSDPNSAVQPEGPQAQLHQATATPLPSGALNGRETWPTVTFQRLCAVPTVSKSTNQ